MNINKIRIVDSFKTVAVFVAILWIILLISYFVPIKGLGIRPRSIIGLIGIPLSPFLHANISHLARNSIALIILGTLLLTFERKLSVIVLFSVILLGGLGTWVIGKSNSIHIGASGVIYGILGYLIAIGIFTRNIKTIVVSVLVFFLYGGLIWGIFPSQPGVSWEGHLCGFLSGIFTAKIYSRYESDSS